MRLNNTKAKKRAILLLSSSLLILTTFSACSDKDDDKETKEVSKVSSTPNIEIIQNTNSKEIKVKVKNNNLQKNSQQESFYYDYGVKSEYSQNTQPANQDADVRIKPRTAVEANMNIRSPYDKVQVSLLTQKLSKNFRLKCSACHDDYANGIIGPSLLSRDADFIYNKIAEFKSGKKSNPLMNDLIKNMSDKEIKEIADEIYAFNKKIKEMRNKK